MYSDVDQLKNKKILIVEDDEMLGNGLKSILQIQKYETYLVCSVKEAMEFFSNHEPDLCILDLWLPDGNGFDLCRWIRKKSEMPVLFLTACEEESKTVEGLKCGGDDYVVKPFSTPVLLARIEVLLRRNRISENTSSYQSSGVVVDMGSRLCCRGDKTLRLPVEEWKMLICLLGAGGKIVSKEQLCRAIWAEGADYVEENTSRVIISRLRKHLDGIGLAGAIETSRGYGYRWILPVEKH